MKKIAIIVLTAIVLLPGMSNAVTKSKCVGNNTLEIGEEMKICIENRTGMGETECSNYTAYMQITCSDGCDYARGQCVDKFANLLMISVLVSIVLIFIFSKIIYR